MINSKQMSVLIVDDSLLNLKLLSNLLSKEGYRVFSASDGTAARRIAVEESPDLILLDIIMPGEDGFSVIKFLKNNTGTTRIPVIFLSGLSEIDSKLEGFELGAVDYIIKPFHPREVLARIRLHLKLSVATNSLIERQAEKLKQLTIAQTSLLVTPESLPDARFGVYYYALHEAGGDFYEVLPVSESIFGYFVADFSGHDISTSYLTASAKALLKQNCTPVYQPAESMKIINDVLVEILPDGKYLTACYAMLNRETMQMTIISAGHPPAVYIPKGGPAELIEMDGDVLGIFSEVVFGRKVLKVSPGDRLFLYSDGLIESPGSKEVWVQGVGKILSACEEAGMVPVEQAPVTVRKTLCPDLRALEDDIVVLAIEV